ncbi:hypothetical protein P6F26_02240 [Roseibacterium sp. SDUM158017]|uniref:DUF6544 family protein n=1 Tax=Roseicyclus salinarum TaxID=3036773 RepID=UPI0024153089|nr:DUF6544 family protein [Roseibacterium sp. SDUM158017]MDG4647251.1 hypothetical protein [Roseibacterium sp. SDUM158017]
MTGLEFAGVALALGVAAGVAAHLVSAARFRAQAARLASAIAEGPAASAADPPDAPRRFALGNIRGDRGPFRAIRIVQDADFRRAETWGPMPAVQHICLGAPGFVWNARAPGPGLLPGLPMFTVIDAHVGGRGLLRANALGSIPVARAEGAVLDRSEAMRYLAELPWAPDAILGNPDIAWRETGAAEVEARIETPSGPAAVRLAFDGAGDIVGMTALRPDTGPGGAEIAREWRGVFTDYGWLGERRIPTRGEVGYVEDGVFRPYWRGRVTSLELLR